MGMGWSLERSDGTNMKQVDEDLIPIVWLAVVIARHWRDTLFDVLSGNFYPMGQKEENLKKGSCFHIERRESGWRRARWF